MKNFINKLFSFLKYKEPKKQGPNTLAELLEQFDQPKKEKTSEDVLKHFCIQIALNQYEYDYLKEQPPKMFLGSFRIKNNDETIDFDFVPCSVRPEVIYSCYYKN